MDEALEKAIDEVGRELVFEAARSCGWTSPLAPPPKYVWWGIVNQLKMNSAEEKARGNE